MSVFQVYEAMEVLEKQMLKDDRVLPNQYVFTVLIGVLGRVGYTKKAFQLFNKVTEYVSFNVSALTGVL
jgi:pentatricopeptide repeat domain-containing protein 1